ncbi:MAG: arylamine N-acetyltransferase [Actinomycetota bacterium]|nr:arylamine N-acetyltransferase [Actinomycetota bacterium]
MAELIVDVGFGDMTLTGVLEFEPDLIQPRGSLQSRRVHAS